jgi:ribose-phosphate pyrophosphokinase
MNKQLKIFAGSAGNDLAAGICKTLDIPQGDIYLHTFPSGEHYCQYKENIRDSDVFLIQPICNPAHGRLMELLVMIDAAKRASAGRITVVAPYLGYLRQDRKTKSRTPITARLVADLLIAAGAQRVVGIDFHCEQAQGFFDIPVDHLYAAPVIIRHLTGDTIPVIVSPDAGGIKRAAAFAESIDTQFAYISKKRISDTEVKVYGITGEVNGQEVLIVDDMTESCGTLIEAAKVCKQHGATKIRAAVTHAMLNMKSFDRLREAFKDGILHELIITNTAVDNKEAEIIKNGTDGKVTILDVSDLLGTAISHINQGLSITELFAIKGF